LRLSRRRFRCDQCGQRQDLLPFVLLIVLLSCAFADLMAHDETVNKCGGIGTS
jgi:hypothetical protein